jgi:hypothetical protein
MICRWQECGNSQTCVMRAVVYSCADYTASHSSHCANCENAKLERSSLICPHLFGCRNVCFLPYSHVSQEWSDLWGFPFVTEALCHVLHHSPVYWIIFFNLIVRSVACRGVCVMWTVLQRSCRLNWHFVYSWRRVLLPPHSPVTGRETETHHYLQ